MTAMMKAKPATRKKIRASVFMGLSYSCPAASVGRGPRGAVGVERQRPDLEVHHRVVRAAQLRAPADEGTFAVDRVLEGAVLVVLVGARHDVPLEVELRHPEGVDDVGGEQ